MANSVEREFDEEIENWWCWAKSVEVSPPPRKSWDDVKAKLRKQLLRVVDKHTEEYKIPENQWTAPTPTLICADDELEQALQNSREDDDGKAK